VSGGKIKFKYSKYQCIDRLVTRSNFVYPSISSQLFFDWYERSGIVQINNLNKNYIWQLIFITWSCCVIIDVPAFFLFKWMVESTNCEVEAMDYIRYWPNLDLTFSPIAKLIERLKIYKFYNALKVGVGWW